MALREYTENIYIEKMTEFSRYLRLEGFAVGMSETADACEILEYLGFEERERVKAALCAIFAKSQAEMLTFGKCFDRFFISLEQKQKNIEEQVKEQQIIDERMRQAQEELMFDGKPMDIREDLQEVYVRMPEEEREKLKRFMDRFRNEDRNPALYGNFVKSYFTKILMEQQMMMEDAAIGAEELDPELSLMFRDISQFKEAEIPKAIEIIRKISQQINGELSSKSQHRGNSGKLDFKRTIRKGLETGGSFQKLKYRKKHAKKRRLVILCDVSGSMVQFSEFALRFIKSLNDVSDNSRVFLFSEKAKEVDKFALQNMDAFRTNIAASGLYGRGTDLGSALETLMAKRPAVLGPSTTLLILSDAKTIDMTRAQRDVIKAQLMAGKTVWLNPIPQRKWDRLNSTRIMSSICQMVPCSTLQELARECRKLAQ